MIPGNSEHIVRFWNGRPYSEYADSFELNECFHHLPVPDTYPGGPKAYAKRVAQLYVVPGLAGVSWAGLYQRITVEEEREGKTWLSTRWAFICAYQNKGRRVILSHTENKVFPDAKQAV